MVIVETVAVAIMISNHLVVPIVLRRRGSSEAVEGEPLPVSDLGGFVLGVRRVAIFVVILLGYAYYRAAGDAGARGDRPPLLRGGGAGRAGLLRRAVLVARHGARRERRARHRLRGLGLYAAASEPRARGRVLDRLRRAGAVRARAAQADRAHGARAAAAHAWRAVEPRAQPPRLCRLLAAAAGERRRAAAGDGLRRHRRRCRWRRASGFSGRASASTICARRSRAISARSAPTAPSRASRKSRGGALEGRSEADIHLLRYAEHLLASAIGAASSRLALSLLAAPPQRLVEGDALQLLDDASAAIQYSRDLLQHALDHARQGITVLDRDLRLARLEPRLHRPLRAAAGARAHRRRPRRDHPLQRRARLLRPRRGRGGDRRTRIHSFVHDAEPRARPAASDRHA